MATKKRSSGSDARRKPVSKKPARKAKATKAASKRPVSGARKGRGKKPGAADLRRKHGSKKLQAMQDHVDRLLAQGAQPNTIVDGLKSSLGLTDSDATAMISINVNAS